MLRRTTLLGVLCLAMIAASGTAKPTPSPVQSAPSRDHRASPPLTPDQIFASAQEAAREQIYPPIVSYVVDVSSQVGSHRYEEEFQAWLRPADGAQATINEPIATTNKPINPYGYDINILGIQLGRRQGVATPFGIPQMSPVFWFGMVEPRPLPLKSAGRSGDSDQTPLPYHQIGRITVTPHDYHIVLVDREAAENHLFYHLRLEPLADAGTHRIREIWIDEQNFKVWKLRAAGIFAVGPPSRALWDVEYRLIDGHLFIESERTSESFRLGGIVGSGVTAYD
ncbi:MAG: hypothetical protein GIX02_02420, partial [Candidatus Eremiobacteraeota bacterium]|nr:hypothetical protein [Candidatus Eremiobacteraeota bacterium]